MPGLRPLHSSEYPIIDTDPIFSRVIRYMRPSDFAVWLFPVALGPFYMYMMERYQPTGLPRVQYIRASKYAARLGVLAGFNMAYIRSSLRFWGFMENEREIKMYREEYRKLKAEGKPMHGTSSLPLHLQRTAASYSTGAFLNLDVFPIYNFVNHPYHGMTEGVIPEHEL
ncbi:hypothetical protein LPJ61_000814 [Coemansia biformis]|uniref:Uncharacterized protein n=1 Tax=Coemansia biformis TaxID=1286918 RepID=A0A9W8D193_9FUNG|nr:hypothetical protein LPJ61_000814 [Coemansia biformis]